MLALIGAILGLLGSLAPEILKFFNNKEDHKHELGMAQLQMEAQKQAGEIKLAEVNALADVEESKALYMSAEQKISGVKWIDGLVSLYSSSVRPSVTYAFFALYAYCKYSVIFTVVKAGAHWQEVGALVWGSEDFAIFATIMGFWFGGRMMKATLDRIDKRGGTVVDLGTTTTTTVVGDDKEPGSKTTVKTTNTGIVPDKPDSSSL
jgi:hypothetical protein